MELVTESRIEGDCEGFDGDRIFTLVNGQRWRQAVYKYKYGYSYRPVAKILIDAGQTVIEIDGMDETVAVRRV